MSLRLAVKRSLDDSSRDDHEIRDAATMIEALQHLSVTALKDYLHPIRKSPFIELPAQAPSQKSQRIDVSLLLEVVPLWLVSRALAVLDAEGKFSTLGEHGSEGIAAALRLLFNVIQLSKKEVIELEDYVDASMDHVVDIIIALVVAALRQMLSLDPSLDQKDFVTLASMQATCFEMTAFCADLELDHHSHHQPSLTALSLHPYFEYFLNASIDIVSCLSDEDNAVGKKIVDPSLVSKILRSAFESLEKLCLVEELLQKLLQSSRLINSLVDSTLALFQNPSQEVAVRDAALKLLLRLSEEDSFNARLAEEDTLKKTRQMCLILESFIIQSFDDGNTSPLVRMLSLQLFVAFSEIPAISENITPGAVSVLLKYIAGDPDDFKVQWTTSQIEYVSLLRLIAALYNAKSSDSRKEFLSKIIGSKGKGAILKKAITSNAVYHPNLIENVAFLLQEVIGSVKWRKLVSLHEASGALGFFEGLDRELGSKRLADEESSAQFIRLKAMNAGFRGQHWRAMWHIHDFRKPISLSNPVSRTQALPRSRAPHAELIPGAPFTVLTPGTVPTVWVTHKVENDMEENISVLDKKSSSAPLNDSGESSAPLEDEDLETAAALLANTSAPTVWVKRQSELDGESEEPVSVMDEPSSLAEFAQTILAPSLAARERLEKSASAAKAAEAPVPSAQDDMNVESSSGGDGSDYESDSRRKPKAERPRKVASPPRGGAVKRKAPESQDTSPTKKPRLAEDDEKKNVVVDDTTGSGIFTGLTFRLSRGVPNSDQIAESIAKNGGLVLQYTTKHTTHFVSTQEEFDEFGPQIQAAKKRQLLLVSPNFVLDSVAAARKLDVAPFLLKADPILK